MLWRDVSCSIDQNTFELSIFGGGSHHNVADMYPSIYRDPMAAAYVYFIRAGERIKVGHSANLGRRLRAFQTGNAEECHVVAAIWLRNADDIERSLKDSLAEYRHRQEWFNCSMRQAVETLWGLRSTFVYDEQPQLDLPTDNPLEHECRSMFYEWVKSTYPDVGFAGGIPERELWGMLKNEFLKAHNECVGVELNADHRYDFTDRP